MKIDHKIYLVLLFFFFGSIFLLSLPSVWDFDIWFHIKSGEIIASEGIIYHDVFAFTTAGRQWSPYEWLFQAIVYFQKQFFGFESIKILTAFLSTAIVFFTFQIFRKIFNLNLFFSLLISFLFFSSTIEFYSPRPQIFAYLFFIINIFLILLYFFKSKNLLWITIPISLCWANLHGSIFLDVLFFLGYAVVSLINYFIQKDKIWINKAKVFGIFTLITAVCSILPPLGTLQYQLLIRFFEAREIISRFISEWGPISVNPISFILLLLNILLIGALFFWTGIKQKVLKQSLWILPILPLVFSAFLASRNAFFSYFALSLVLGWIVANINFKSLSKKLKYALIVFIGLILIFHVWMLFDKKREQNLGVTYYPEAAVNFIKNNNFQGNMFNEYGFGGYLLYHLYPEQKVYIDGRTDLYLCCEMPDTLELAYKKNLPDEEYKKYLDILFEKNKISYVLMRTEKHVLLRKIAHILQNDPNWKLVFWDDWTMIFVKNDGKNDEIIKNFSASAATPYERDPYLPKTETTAFEEYQKMASVADSSKSRNSIGFLFLKQNKIAEAKLEFEKAITLNPLNESPYMNLAEIYASEGDIIKAIELYQKAKGLAPDRGLIYIRIGQLFLKDGKPKEKTLEIWQEGLQKTVDSDAKQKLQQLISGN
jgi:tetratricopeptide (TPR) repeat protein